MDDNTDHPLTPPKCILCDSAEGMREMEGVSALSFYETNNVLTIDERLPPPRSDDLVACGHCTTSPSRVADPEAILPYVYRLSLTPNGRSSPDRSADARRLRQLTAF